MRVLYLLLSRGLQDGAKAKYEALRRGARLPLHTPHLPGLDLKDSVASAAAGLIHNPEALFPPSLLHLLGQ